jgi:hypothetical protein
VRPPPSPLAGWVRKSFQGESKIASGLKSLLRFFFKTMSNDLLERSRDSSAFQIVVGRIFTQNGGDGINLSIPAKGLPRG